MLGPEGKRMSEQRYSRILGCMVGNAIGDAFGGVVEGASAERVKRVTGKDWVDEFLPYPESHGVHPLGTWEKAPPRGTVTDDGRYNQIFVECVIRNGGQINSQLLAMEYLQLYRDRDALYGKHAALAEDAFGNRMVELSEAHLGMTPSSGRPAWAVLSQGNYQFPALQGLISLALAGLLFAGEPEKAYVTAFELDFRDIGYARDATAMMAAMVSAALAGGVTAREMVQVALDTDPFGFGKRKYDKRVMDVQLRRFLELADQANDDRSLIEAISRHVSHRHIFDPVDVLGTPVAALCHCNGDPIRTIAMAVNNRDLDDDGNLVRLRDVDCTGSVAGALAGALNGIEAFPQDWIADTIAANKQVYGIDIESNARRFCELVHGG
jgi:ADP-ribosylglycohydrolase